MRSISRKVQTREEWIADSIGQSRSRAQSRENGAGATDGVQARSGAVSPPCALTSSGGAASLALSCAALVGG